jgi:hypothetical protein
MDDIEVAGGDEVLQVVPSLPTGDTVIGGEPNHQPFDGSRSWRGRRNPDLITYPALSRGQIMHMKLDAAEARKVAIRDVQNPHRIALPTAASRVDFRRRAG